MDAPGVTRVQPSKGANMINLLQTNQISPCSESWAVILQFTAISFQLRARAPRSRLESILITSIKASRRMHTFTVNHTCL